MVAYLAWLINKIIDAYILLIVVWCLLTWFPGAMQSRFAPVVAVFVLYLVQYGIIMLTRMIGY